MPSFETIPPNRSDCSEITCRMRGDQPEAIAGSGWIRTHEITQAFDETPHPTAWLIDGELAAMGGVRAPPGLCPLGIVWLVVAEHAVRFRCALVREIGRQLESCVQLHPILVSAALSG